MSSSAAPLAGAAYNGRMRLSDRQITSVVAIATFIGLTAISAVVWAVTRPDAPDPVTPIAAASAMPAGHPTFETITAEEVKALADRGEVVLIDVRSAEQFVGLHIDKALHIPVASIEGEIEYLPKGKLVVTYCTCPAEESSGQAAMILQRAGVEAKALKGGLEAWTSLGYPTAIGVK